MATIIEERGSGRRTRVFYGWYMVAACATIACFSWGLGFYGIGVYLSVLRDQNGWSTGLISLAVTVYYLAGAAGLLLVGSLIDRHGPRGVLAYGSVVIGLCVAAMGYLTAIWQLFAIFLLMSTAWASLGSTALSATLLPWFQQKRGRAMSLALTGPSFGGIVLVPLLVQLTDRYGFHVATAAIALLQGGCILVLVALVIRRRPADLGMLPDGASSETRASDVTLTAGDGERAWSRADALRSPLFWTLALPFSLAVMAQVAFIVHQLSFLEPLLGRSRASAAVSLTTLAALAGRLVMAALADRIDRRLFAAACFLAQAAGLALLATFESAAALFAGSIAVGLGVGVVITLPALLTGDEFGVRSFGAIFAMISAGMQLTVAAGPGIVGVARDHWGGYAAPLWLLAGAEIVSALLVVFGGRYAHRRPARKAA